MSSATRLRVPHKIHVLSWALALEKYGSVPCHFQNCQFMALSIEEMGYHYQFCACENNKYPFVCETCSRRTDAIEKLLLHKSCSHSYTPTHEESQKIDDYLKAPRKKEVTSVLKRSWEIFLETKKYLKCLKRKCLFVTESLEIMEDHYLNSCKENFWSQLKYECEFCLGRLLNDYDLKLHVRKAHGSKTYLTKIDLEPDSVRKRLELWSEDILLNKQGKCFIEGCQFVDNYVKILEKHYAGCDGTKKNFIICCACGSWLLNEARLNEHKRCFHKDLDEEDFRRLSEQYEVQSKNHSSLLLDDMSPGENDPHSGETEGDNDRRANDLKKYNGVINRSSRKSSSVRPSQPVFPAKNTNSIDCVQVSDRSGIQYDSDIIKINEGSLDIIDIDSSVTKKVLNDGMKLDETKKRRRSNQPYVIEKNYIKDSERKNLILSNKKNQENLSTPLQAFANEMMKENKNVSTIPIQIKVDNKDWTVNVSTTVVSQTKSSSEFPKNREALFKSLKEESYRLLKLVSKKNSIRNDVRMVFDPYENRITPFHIDFKKGNCSNDNDPDNLDMTKFLSSDLEDSDDNLSNSDMSVCDGPGSSSSPRSFLNVEHSDVKVIDEVHNFNNEESFEQDTSCLIRNETGTIDPTLKQSNNAVEGVDSGLPLSNENLLPTCSGSDANSDTNLENGFKNESNDDLFEGPSQIVALSKAHDDQHANSFPEEESNRNTSNKGTDILCLSEVNHLGEEVMVKKESNQQSLPKTVIDPETGAVVHIEVFEEDNQQCIIPKSEEGAENHMFEAEYIIPEIDFVDSSGFKSSGEKINVSVSFHTDSSNSSYDLESEAGISLTEDEESGMHCNDASQDVSGGYLSKPNEELVLLDNELATSSSQGTESDGKGDKDPLSIDGNTGGTLFYDPETDYDNKDVYSSDKNEPCSHEKNSHLSENIENCCSDSSLESNEENTNYFNSSNKWNWSNLKKYNSKTTPNALTNIHNSYSKEQTNKQPKEDERFVGFSDCTNSSSKYCDFVSACSKLGYYDDMVILNQHYEIIPPNKKDLNFLKPGGTDPERVFRGFKSNDNYVVFRRKSIEISRRLSEDFSEDKNKKKLSLNNTAENISGSLVEKKGQDVCKKKRSTSLDSAPKKRGRPRKDQTKFSINIFKDSLNQKGNVDAKSETIDHVENDNVSVVNHLPNPSGEEQNEPSLTISSESNSDLSKLTVTDLMPCMNSSQIESNVSYVEVEGADPRSADDTSLTHTESSSTCTLNLDSEEVDQNEKILEDFVNMVPRKRGRPKKKQQVTPSLTDGNNVNRVEDLKKIQNKEIPILNCIPKSGEQESAPIIVSNNHHETGHLKSRDEVEDKEDHCANEASLIPLDNKENILSTSVELVSRKGNRLEKNQSESMISKATIQCNGSFDLKEENIEHEESDNFDYNDQSVNKKLVAKEQTPPLLNASNDNLNVPSKSSTSELTNCERVDCTQEISSALSGEMKLIYNSKPISTSVPAERKSVHNVSEGTKKNPVQLIASTPTKSSLPHNEENTNTGLEESNPFDNEESIINTTANEHSLAVNSSLSKNEKISKEPVTHEITSSVLKQEHNPEEIIRMESIVSGTPLKRKPGRPPKRLSLQSEGSDQIQKKNSVLLDTSLALSPSDNRSVLLNSPADIDCSQLSSNDQKDVSKKSQEVLLIEKKDILVTPVKRKPGRPPKRMSLQLEGFEQLQKKSNNICDNSLTNSDSSNRSLLLNSSAITECGQPMCSEQKDVDIKSRDISLNKKEGILQIPLKRKPGRPPKRMSLQLEGSDQLQKETSDILDTSLAISLSANRSVLLNSPDSVDCAQLSCSEQKNVSNISEETLLIEKKDILVTPVKRKPGRPPKHRSLSFQRFEQLQKKSNNICDNSLTNSDSSNRSLLLNSSAITECGQPTCSEQKDVDIKSRDISLNKKEGILQIPLKRKPGRPPKRLSLQLERSDQLQKETSNILDTSLAISLSANRSVLLNSPDSVDCAQLSCSEQKNVSNISEEALLIEDILVTPVKRKPGRPTKHRSLSFQGSEHLQKKSDNICDRSLTSSDSSNTSLLFNSPTVKECVQPLCSEQKEVDIKSRDVSLSKNEDIPEIPLKRKPGRPPKRLSQCLLGSIQFQTKNSTILDQSLGKSPTGSKRLLLSSSTDMDCRQSSCSELKDVDNKCSDALLIEKEYTLEHPLKRKPGRPPKRKSAGKGEICGEKMNISVENSESSMNSNFISTSFSKEDKAHVHLQFKTNSSLSVYDQLHQRNVSDLKSIPNSTSNELENNSYRKVIIDPEKKYEIESVSSDLKSEIKSPRSSEDLFVSVNGQESKSNQKKTDEVLNSCQSSSNIVEKNTFIFNSHTNMHSISSSIPSENEEANFKAQNSVLIKNKDILELPLKRKPGRPPKHSLQHRIEINQYGIDDEAKDIMNSTTDIEISKSQDKLLMSQKDFESPVEVIPGRQHKSVSMCQQKIQQFSIENVNSYASINNKKEDVFSLLSPEVDNEKLINEKINTSEDNLCIDRQEIANVSNHELNVEEKSIIVTPLKRKPGRPPKRSSVTHKETENIKIEKSDFQDATDRLRGKEINSFEPPPKRKPGRPPKRFSIGESKIKNSKRFLNNSLSELMGIRNVTSHYSEEDIKNIMVSENKINFETPLKRKPGRPPKHLSVSQKRIGMFQYQNISIDSSEPAPKRKPGQPRKVSLEIMSIEENAINNSMDGAESPSQDRNENCDESSNCIPKRKPGRSRKVSLIATNIENNDLDSSSDPSNRLNFERSDISIESSFNSEPSPKRRCGRPRKYKVGPDGIRERLATIATSTPFPNETAATLSFDSFADIELLDDSDDDENYEKSPKKRCGRQGRRKFIRKGGSYPETSYKTFNDDNLENSFINLKEEKIPDLNSSSSLTVNLEDTCVNNGSEIDLPQETDCQENDLTSKQKERREKRKLLSGRVDSSTRLKNPNDKVKCALCGEIMTVVQYQRVHLLKHNFMSWLEGEEPLPLDDLDKMETILTRGKRANPKFNFRCEVCHLEKKSSKGLLSHRQFCGKSDKEREGMMVTCSNCGRLMMPASLQPHKYQCFKAPTGAEEKTEELSGPVRKAAAKCLGKIASLIEENGLSKNGEDFHADGDDEFDEIEEISLLYIPVQNKKTTKHLMNRWKQLARYNKELHCVVPICKFKTRLLKDIVHHHKTCTADGSQSFSCIKCNYICKMEDEMREHVKSCNPPIMVSQSENSEDEDQEKHVVIPYLKTAEQNLHVRHKALFFKPALTWMMEIYKKYFTQEPLYPDLHLNIDLWEEMNPQTSQFYNPEKSKSMMVSFQNSSWESMHALEGKVIEGNQGIAYTGGPIWGLEWCPGEGPQYLAVSSHLSMEFNFQAGSTFTGPGLVQLWSLEDISNSKSDSLSTLQFCYGVCHNDRACWNMAWCPSGGRTDTRIGLLALATTSGSIPIYAMPNPDCLQYQSTRFYKPEPVLRLEIWSNERWQCSAISWSKIKPHNIIVAGFVNGMVAVWNLESQSKLLRKNNILYPFKVFQAHHSIITGVCLSPESDTYLATASYDKSFKYWDLIDTTAPHSVLKRGLLTSVDWLRHWMSAVTTFDNAYTMMQTTASLSSVRGFVNTTTPVTTGINSTAWSVSVNDWLNGAITSYDNGQVVLFLALRQSTHHHLDKRKYSKVILNTTLHNIEAKEGPLEPNSKQKEKELLNNNMPSNSYGDAIEKYGLAIRIDPDVGRSDSFQEKGSENVIDIYPLSSVNRVAWNTNKNSFLYTAMGYQSGFLVVSKISFNVNDLSLINEVTKS